MILLWGITIDYFEKYNRKVLKIIGANE